MKRDDIRKLLGGYATGTLSDAERKALFDAAMEDQSLFDALADDAALQELLDQPQAREYLLEALPARPKAVVRRMPVWRWTAVGSVAAALVLGVFLVRAPVPQKPAAPPVMASSQLRSELDVPPVKAESRLKALKQEAFAPPVLLSKRAQADLSAPVPASAPLPQPDRDKLEDSKMAVNLPVAKEKMAPVALAENRVAEQSASVDAVRAQPAAAAAPAESATLSTAATGSLQLLDRTAQTQQGARQLFYGTGAVSGLVAGRQDAPVAAKRAAVLPASAAGLRYTLLRRQPDGSYVEADPTTVFHAGDAIRLRIETNSAGYLAVWNRSDTLANISVLARTRYTIPAEGAIELHGPPENRKLLVVFSRALQTKPAGLAGGLLVEQSTERATYVADPRPSSLVSFEITLIYR